MESPLASFGYIVRLIMLKFNGTLNIRSLPQALEGNVFLKIRSSLLNLKYLYISYHF